MAGEIEASGCKKHWVTGKCSVHPAKRGPRYKHHFPAPPKRSSNGGDTLPIFPLVPCK